jgi:hypothetical protein
MENKGARYLNIALGAWLFVSAFLWHHDTAQLANALIVGIIAMAAGVASLTMPAFRYATTAVAAWLVVSAFALPHLSAGTVWNHVLVGTTMFYVSLVESPTVTSRKAPGGALGAGTY